MAKPSPLQEQLPKDDAYYARFQVPDDLVW